MSRPPQPAYRLAPALSLTPDEDGSISGVEDSLHRGSRPAEGSLFSRPAQHPASGEAYALSSAFTTPPAIPHAGTRPPQGTAVAGMETPNAGPAFPFRLPPPLERPIQRAPTLAPVSLATAHAGSLYSPTSADESAAASFSFARPAQARMLAMPPPPAPTRHALPPRATAAHTPTAGVAAAGVVTPANLDAAALAAERRIREQRAVSRGGATVDFTTPPAVERAVQDGRPPALVRYATTGPNARRSVGNDDGSMLQLGRAPTMRGYADGSLSLSTDVSTGMLPTRLFALPSHPPQPQPQPHAFHTPPPQPPSQQGASELSISYTLDTSHSASTSAAAARVVRLRKWDGTPVSVPAYLVSDAAESAVEELFDYDTTARFDVAALLSAHTARVNGCGELDVAGTGDAGEAGEEGSEGKDVLQAILEVQLGLRGMHGWYGHTYRNPLRSKAQSAPQSEGTDGRTSRKRRRRSSSSASSLPSSPPPAETRFSSTTKHAHSEASQQRQQREEETEDEEGEEETGEMEPIVVYDTFGRVRGTVTLPNYTRRGGPSFPLPNPRESFAIRHAAAAQRVRVHGSALAAKEATLAGNAELLKQRYRELQAGGEHEGKTIKSGRFYAELKANVRSTAAFRSKHRQALLKGLQNAYVDSVSLASRPR